MKGAGVSCSNCQTWNWGLQHGTVCVCVRPTPTHACPSALSLPRLLWTPLPAQSHSYPLAFNCFVPFILFLFIIIAHFSIISGTSLFLFSFFGWNFCESSRIEIEYQIFIPFIINDGLGLRERDTNTHKNK